MKLKTRIITTITVAVFFANIITLAATTSNATDPEQISLISILAMGTDKDIPGAKTFIEGKT